MAGAAATAFQQTQHDFSSLRWRSKLHTFAEHFFIIMFCCFLAVLVICVRITICDGASVRTQNSTVSQLVFVSGKWNYTPATHVVLLVVISYSFLLVVFFFFIVFPFVSVIRLFRYHFHFLFCSVFALIKRKNRIKTTAKTSKDYSAERNKNFTLGFIAKRTRKEKPSETEMCGSRWFFMAPSASSHSRRTISFFNECSNVLCARLNE